MSFRNKDLLPKHAKCDVCKDDATKMVSRREARFLGYFCDGCGIVAQHVVSRLRDASMRVSRKRDRCAAPSRKCYKLKDEWITFVDDAEKAAGRKLTQPEMKELLQAFSARSQSKRKPK